MTRKLRQMLSTEFSGTALTIAIIAFAFLLIFLAFTIQNKWLKAGILAWEILP